MGAKILGGQDSGAGREGRGRTIVEKPLIPESDETSKAAASYPNTRKLVKRRPSVKRERAIEKKGVVREFRAEPEHERGESGAQCVHGGGAQDREGLEEGDGVFILPARLAVPLVGRFDEDIGERGATNTCYITYILLILHKALHFACNALALNQPDRLHGPFRIPPPLWKPLLPKPLL
jgi:hypothetical protein